MERSESRTTTLTPISTPSARLPTRRRDFGGRHHQLAHHATQRERHRRRRALQRQEHRCAGGRLLFLPSVDGANTAPLVDVSKIGDPTACTTLPAGSLNNSFALIVYSSCSFDTAASNAQTAGAVGFVFILPAGTAVAPFDDTPPHRASTNTVLRFDLQRRRPEPEELHRCEPNQQVTIDLPARSRMSPRSAHTGFPSRRALTANMVPGYSSFGPRPMANSNRISWPPELDTSYSGLSGGFYVPTQSFDAYDSALYSANGFMAVDGTSFSAALTAGAAALVIQAHPGLRGTQVRSLIVNSSPRP